MIAMLVSGNIPSDIARETALDRLCLFDDDMIDLDEFVIVIWVHAQTWLLSRVVLAHVAFGVCV